MEQIIPNLRGQELVGVILPVFVEILSKDIPPNTMVKLKVWRFSHEIEERFLLCLTLCFLAALYLTWDKLSFISWNSVLAYFGLVFTEAQLVYKLYFRGSFIQSKLQDKLNTPTLLSEDEVEAAG